MPTIGSKLLQEISKIKTMYKKVAIEKLYSELLAIESDNWSFHYARSMLEGKIKRLVEKGLNRDQAIRELAEKEDVLEVQIIELEKVIREKVTKEEKPDPTILYKELLNYYSDLYGSGIRFEKEIESYIKQGLSRDEAILEISKNKGFIEEVKAANNNIKKKEKPDPISELHGQLVNYYRNLYSNGNRLEREIEQYIKQGLSRDKAILKIAETKGFIEIEQTSM